jgi:predicted RNase H-like nuclease (RuvC/YqgF family)
MTELETHLLTALKNLQGELNGQLKASGQAQRDLQSMFERTAQDNARLSQQVMSLQEQVKGLTQQLRRFGSLYEQNRR